MGISIVDSQVNTMVKQMELQPTRRCSIMQIFMFMMVWWKGWLEEEEMLKWIAGFACWGWKWHFERSSSIDSLHCVPERLERRHNSRREQRVGRRQSLQHDDDMHAKTNKAQTKEENLDPHRHSQNQNVFSLLGNCLLVCFAACPFAPSECEQHQHRYSLYVAPGTHSCSFVPFFVFVQDALMTAPGTAVSTAQYSNNIP